MHSTGIRHLLNYALAQIAGRLGVGSTLVSLSPIKQAHCVITFILHSRKESQKTKFVS